MVEQVAAVAVGVGVVTNKVAAVTALLMRSAKLTPHSEFLPFQLISAFQRHHRSLQGIKAAEVRQQPVAATNAVAGMAPGLVAGHVRLLTETKPERQWDR